NRNLPRFGRRWKMPDGRWPSWPRWGEIRDLPFATTYSRNTLYRRGTMRSGRLSHHTMKTPHRIKRSTMKWVHYFLLFLLVSGLPGVARAQNQLRNDPGFVDFAEIDRWFDSEARIEVNIHGALLRLVAEASRNEDPDFANVLNRLKGIYVRGYTLPPSQYGKIERNASEL